MSDLPAQTAGTAVQEANTAQFGLAQMWAGLVDLAKDPDVDPAKMQALVGIQTEMVDRESLRRFTQAKHNAMAEMPRVTKNKRIVHAGRNGEPDKIIAPYRDYDSLRVIIDPILTRNGLKLSHTSGIAEGMKMPTCSAILSWTDGELSYVEQSEPMPIPIDSSGSKSGAQGVASSLTYGKRHTTTAMLGIVFDGEDDDATSLVVVPKLSQSEQDLVASGQVAASKGTDGYAAWFRSLDQMTRGYLVDSGHHETLKKAAQDHDTD